MDQPPVDVPKVVMAAPNESKVTARVIGVKQSPQWPDKWELEIDLIASERVQGPEFARPGQRLQAFAFGLTAPARVSDTIKARAEYIGGARGGQLQLSDIVVHANQPTLHGTIQLPSAAFNITGARAYVMIEDVSRANASSQIVTRQTIEIGPAQGGAAPSASFTLPLDGLEPRKAYSVRVHVDVDGDGAVSPGDYVSTESYPVTRESETVAVTVHPVR